MREIITIEVLERYVSNREQLEQLENLGLDKDKNIEYRYRRTNPRLDDIERVIEIPDNNEECKLRFYSGHTMTILGNFDEICIAINDLWNGNIEEETEN